MLSALLPRLTTPTAGVPAPAAGLAESSARHVRAALRLDAAASDGSHGFRVAMTVAPGWSLRLPEGLRLDGEGVELLEVEFPASAHGEFEVHGRLRKDAPRGRVLVSFHVCDESRCLAPAEIGLAVS